MEDCGEVMNGLAAAVAEELEAARSRVRKPVGRQPIASIRASQPKLVCGPWWVMPPKR